MDKLYDQSFFQERDVGMGIRAELVGDKIYISAHRLNEFMIYDPSKSRISGINLMFDKSRMNF